MPLPPKPPARRQRRNASGVGLVAVPEGGLEPHPSPGGLLEAQRESWATFWRSPMAPLVMDADIPALRRLWTLRDEWERCYREAKDERVTLGSNGQMVLHPLYKHMSTLESAIERLEAQFGLTPMARLKLGVTFGEARRSLEEVNAAAAADEGEDEDLFGDLIDVTSHAARSS